MSMQALFDDINNLLLDEKHAKLEDIRTILTHYSEDLSRLPDIKVCLKQLKALYKLTLIIKKKSCLKNDICKLREDKTQLIQNINSSYQKIEQWMATSPFELDKPILKLTGVPAQHARIEAIRQLLNDNQTYHRQQLASQNISTKRDQSTQLIAELKAEFDLIINCDMDEIDAHRQQIAANVKHIQMLWEQSVKHFTCFERACAVRDTEVQIKSHETQLDLALQTLTTIKENEQASTLSPETKASLSAQPEPDPEHLCMLIEQKAQAYYQKSSYLTLSAWSSWYWNNGYNNEILQLKAELDYLECLKQEQETSKTILTLQQELHDLKNAVVVQQQEKDTILSLSEALAQCIAFIQTVQTHFPHAPKAKAEDEPAARAGMLALHDYFSRVVSKQEALLIKLDTLKDVLANKKELCLAHDVPADATISQLLENPYDPALFNEILTLCSVFENDYKALSKLNANYKHLELELKTCKSKLRGKNYTGILTEIDVVKQGLKSLTIKTRNHLKTSNRPDVLRDDENHSPSKDVRELRLTQLHQVLLKHKHFQTEPRFLKWAETLCTALQTLKLEEGQYLQACALLVDLQTDLNIHETHANKVLSQYIKICPNPSSDLCALLKLKPRLAIDKSEPCILENKTLRQTFEYLEKHRKNLVSRQFIIEAALLKDACEKLYFSALEIEQKQSSLLLTEYSLLSDPRYHCLKEQRGILRVLEWIVDFLYQLLSKTADEVPQAPYFSFFKTKSQKMLERAEEQVRALSVSQGQL